MACISSSTASCVLLALGAAQREPREKLLDLDTFDFLAIPSLNKALVLDLARCEFIERKENVLALGNSGTGNPHRSGVGPGRLPEGLPRPVHHRGVAGA
jgi:hypothetical protein